MTTAILSLLTGLSPTDTQLLQSAPKQLPSAAGDSPTALTALPAQSLNDKIGLFQSLLTGEERPLSQGNGKLFSTALNQSQKPTSETTLPDFPVSGSAQANASQNPDGQNPLTSLANQAVEETTPQTGKPTPSNPGNLPFPEVAALQANTSSNLQQSVPPSPSSSPLVNTDATLLPSEATTKAVAANLNAPVTTGYTAQPLNGLPSELPPNPLAKAENNTASNSTTKPLLAQGALYNTSNDAETLNNLITRFAQSHSLQLKPEAGKPVTPQTGGTPLTTVESLQPVSTQTLQAANLQAANLTRETQPAPELTTQVIRQAGQKEALTVKDTPVIQPNQTQNPTLQAGAGQAGTPTIPSPVSLVAAPQSDSAFPSSLPSHADGAAQLPLGLSNTPLESAATKEPPAYTQQQSFVQKSPAEQLQMQIAKAVKDGSHNITIQLEPQSLGKVDIRMDIGVEGRLQMTMLVDRPETLDLLRNDARALERALNDAGLKTDSNSLSFDLRGQQQQFGQGKQGQYGQFALSQGNETTEDLLQELVAGEARNATHYGYSGDGALDITV